MSRVTKSLRVDGDLWKEVKVHVAQIGEEISTFIEDAIKEKLKKKK